MFHAPQDSSQLRVRQTVVFLVTDIDLPIRSASLCDQLRELQLSPLKQIDSCLAEEEEDQ